MGCEACDGTTSHVGHGEQRFLYKGMDPKELARRKVTIPNPFTPKPGEMVLDPKSRAGIAITPGCSRADGNGTSISGQIATSLTTFGWMCVGIHRRRVLPSPMGA